MFFFFLLQNSNDGNAITIKTTKSKSVSFFHQQTHTHTFQINIFFFIKNMEDVFIFGTTFARKNFVLINVVKHTNAEVEKTKNKMDLFRLNKKKKNYYFVKFF